MTGRPRVGISRCLTGDEVRYDGTHRRQPALLSAFGDRVEWIPVCPEVEVGMGTPREPVQLIPGADGVPSGAGRVRMVGVSSGRDWTVRMHAWARERAAALRALALDGFVLKARSPSCGIDLGATRGLFVEALIEAMPDLPLADEEELQDPRRREEFLSRITR